MNSQENMSSHYDDRSAFPYGTPKPRHALLKSFIVFTVILAFSALWCEWELISIQIFIALSYASTTYLIFYTGKASLYRKIIFITSGALFFFSIKYFSSSACLDLSCPISTSYLLPSILSNILANPMVFRFSVFAILWLLLAVFAGSLWCSWICWFGSIDEFFSSILKKPILKFDKLSEAFSETPVAVLIYSMLVALSTGTASYCLWVCPFKIFEAFLDKNHTIMVFQTISLISVGFFALVLFPLLTKKRIFCRFICPLGGLLRLTHRFHPFKVYLDKSVCGRCGKCVPKCPMLAIDKNFSVSPYCTRCLTCIFDDDDMALKTNVNIDMLIIFALSLGGIIASLYLPSNILRILALLRR